jgi:hypothetical protein
MLSNTIPARLLKMTRKTMMTTRRYLMDLSFLFASINSEYRRRMMESLTMRMRMMRRRLLLSRVLLARVGTSKASRGQPSSVKWS